MPQRRSIKIIKSVDRQQSQLATVEPQECLPSKREEMRLVKATLADWIIEIQLKNRQADQKLASIFAQSGRGASDITFSEVTNSTTPGIIEAEA